MNFKFLVLSCFSILFFKKIEKQTFRKRRKTKNCSAITTIVKITYPHTSVFCFCVFYFFVILFFVFAKFKLCFFVFIFPRRYTMWKNWEFCSILIKKRPNLVARNNNFILYACLSIHKKKTKICIFLKNLSAKDLRFVHFLIFGVQKLTVSMSSPMEKNVRFFFSKNPNFLNLFL